MVAARTITIIKPKSQHEPMDIRIPKGTALVALAASSLMWTHESNAPMVQIGDSQLSMNAHPVGHVVRLEVSAKMKWPSLRRFLAPIGRAMIVAAISTKFKTTKTVCNFPMILLMTEASIA